MAVAVSQCYVSTAEDDTTADMLGDFVIATACSHGYFYQLENLIGSIHHWEYDNVDIVVDRVDRRISQLRAAPYTPHAGCDDLVVCPHVWCRIRIRIVLIESVCGKPHCVDTRLQERRLGKHWHARCGVA